MALFSHCSGHFYCPFRPIPLENLLQVAFKFKNHRTPVYRPSTHRLCEGAHLATLHAQSMFSHSPVHLCLFERKKIEPRLKPHCQSAPFARRYLRIQNHFMCADAVQYFREIGPCTLWFLFYFYNFFFLQMPKPFT